MNQHDRRKLGRRAERLAALSRTGAALMRAGDERSIWRVLAHTARDFTEAAFAAVIVRPVREEHKEGGPPAPPTGAGVHLAVTVGLSQEQAASLRRVLLSRDELLAPLWQGAEPFRVPGPLALAPPPAEPSTSAGQEAIAQTAQEQPQREGPADQPLVPALLGVPLLAPDGQVQGGLLVGLHELAQVSREDEALLVSLTAQVALALDKVRCVQLAQEQVQELQAVLDQLAEGIVQVDAQGHIVRENAVARRLREQLQAAPKGAQALAALLQAPARLALTDQAGEPALVRVPGDDTHRRVYAVTARPLPALALPAGPFAQESQPSPTATGRGAGAMGVVVWHEVADERAEEMTDQPDAEVEGELAAWVRQTAAIFEAMADAVLVYDRSATLVQVNMAARRLLGLDVVPDYASRSLEDRFALYVVRDLQGQVLPREQWPISRLMRGEVLADEQAMEVLLRTADGRQIQASITSGQVRDQHGRLLGVVLTMRDRSERYRLERELQEAEQLAREQASQLAAIFEAMPEALLVSDREGRTIRMNAAGQQLFERLYLSNAAAAPLARRIAKVIAWDAQGQPLARESFPNARILAGERLTPGRPVEIALRDQQGEPMVLSVSGGPLRDQQEQLVGAVTIIRDITAHKHAERGLQQQAQQLQLQAKLIELAHDAIVVRDADGRVVSWNQGAEQLYGWSAQEARGRLIHELLPTHHLPARRAAVAAHLEREGQWQGELQHTSRDGRKVLVESYQALVRDEAGRPTAILEINRDITLRRRLEAFTWRMHTTTEARRSLLQLVLDELPSSVYLVRGRDARLVLANRATTAIWGASWALHQPLSEFQQQNKVRICGLDGRELALEQRATWRALQHGEAVSQHQEIIRQPDGTSLPVLVNAVPLDLSPLFPLLEESNLAGTQATEPAALVVHQDVSALREAERLKDEFIAIAAHELRTPLAILKGYADTLLLGLHGRKWELAEWQQEALDNIDLATRQLVELTEELLDVTRLQAGRLELHPEAADLVALTRRIVKRLQRTTQQHRLSLRSSQEHQVVTLDPRRMEQVLTNLVGNAIKYSPQGGPIEVAIWAEPQTAEVVLSVRDEGIGIPAQHQASIFGRFFRAMNARTLPGTGLGLYICRSLVELHGGRLWFESVEERGTTFFLALPYEGEAAALA